MRPEKERIPTTSTLEKRAWKLPNGAILVELIDNKASTWEVYCQEIRDRNPATREKPSLTQN